MSFRFRLSFGAISGTSCAVLVLVSFVVASAHSEVANVAGGTEGWCDATWVNPLVCSTNPNGQAKCTKNKGICVRIGGIPWFECQDNAGVPSPACVPDLDCNNDNVPLLGGDCAQP